MRLGNLRQSILLAVDFPCGTGLLTTRLGLQCLTHPPGSLPIDCPNMHAGVLVTSILGLGSYSLVDYLHPRLCPWQFVR